MRTVPATSVPPYDGLTTADGRSPSLCPPLDLTSVAPPAAVAQIVNTPAARAQTTLSVRPSTYRPAVKAVERLWAWSILNATEPDDFLRRHPELATLAAAADRNVVRAGGRHDSALAKYYKYCDATGLPEAERLSTSLTILKRFLPWCCFVPDPADGRFRLAYEAPIAVETAAAYVSALKDWHRTHGQRWPLESADDWELGRLRRGITNVQAGTFRRVPWPPFKLSFLRLLGERLE